jgi:autotransporter adhesin
MRGKIRDRRIRILSGSVAGLAIVVGQAPLNRVEAQPLVNACSGFSVTMPILQPVTNVASGLLTGLLDPVLNGIIGNINTGIVNGLSGQQIGVAALDQNGNVVAPGNCNLGVDGVTVDANKGITLGGGQIGGLGGTASAPASAGEINSIALGNGATTDVAALNAIAIGLRGSVTATDGVALGRDAAVSVIGGVALGAGSAATRAGMAGAAERFSGTAVASTAGAVSVGAPGAERQITNVAGGTADTDAVNVRQLRAVGDNLASGLGGGASFDPATGAYTGPNYVIGGNTYTDVGTALTALNNATIFGSTAIAANNTSGFAPPTAAGNDALAVGYGATAAGTRAAAFGTGATAGGNDSVALGADANAAGDGAVAIGSRATAAQPGAVAIGANARTTRANQVAVGTQGSTYTMAGIGSAQSAAAQSGPTHFVTADAAGNLATSSFDPGAFSSQITSLNQSIQTLRKETRQGVASAMSMGSAPMPSAPGRTSWALNTATFMGEWAAGISVAHRLNLPVNIALTGAVSTGGDNTVGVRMGLAGEF